VCETSQEESNNYLEVLIQDSGEMDLILAKTVSYLDDCLYEPKQRDGADVFQVK